MILKKLFGITVILATLASNSTLSAVDQYTLTIEGEQAKYVSDPQLGYVVKMSVINQKSTNRGESVRRVAHPFLPSMDTEPVRRLDSYSIFIVKELQLKKVTKIHNLQQAPVEVSYLAPLFSVNGEMVGIIPEIVLKVEPNITSGKIQEICDDMNLTVVKPMEFTTREYLLEVHGSDADAVFATIRELNKLSFVEWAWPNILFKPSFDSLTTGSEIPSRWKQQEETTQTDVNSPGVFPNDEYFHFQWHLCNTGQSDGTPGADINAPKAWEITTGDPNIIVGLPDTGVDPNHPDLVNNLVSGYDFWDDDELPYPDSQDRHGTGCAGLVAATGNNTIGVTGVTWDCKIMPIKVETVDGVCSDADIATAFRWMAREGADVISNSWGFGAAVPITHSAIIDITKSNGLGREGKGCVIIDATGNTGRNRVRLIGRYPEVIAVGATDHNDRRCYYSNYGSDLDIVAPSGWQNTLDDWLTSTRGGLWTTDLSGLPGASSHPLRSEIRGLEPYFPDDWDYAAFSGTSGAAPIASGVAALILSIEPTLTDDEVRHFLCRSAKDLGEPGWDQYYGWGRVDAYAALDMVLAKRADLNNNWKVDIIDLLILIEFWRTDEPSVDIAPATKRDGIVDEQDLELLIRYWQTEIPEMDLIEQ